MDMYKNLKKHILREGLIPVVVLIVCLCFFSATLAILQLRADFKYQIGVTTEQIAGVLTSAISTNNPETIRQLTETSLNFKGVSSLRLSSTDGLINYQEGQSLQIEAWPDRALRKTLEQQGQSLLTTTRLQSTLGQTYWLELEFTTRNLLIGIYQWLLLAIALAIVALPLTWLIMLRLANHITCPLRRLTTQLSHIDPDNLKAGLLIDRSDDFSPLIKHLNQMLTRIQLRYHDMKDDVEWASHEIHNNMEILELKNAELDYSRKQAVDANRSKSMFLANVSHEMNTPLNSILGYCGLLSKTRLDSLQQEHLHTMQSSAEGLKAIISDILDISTIEAGKLHLEHKPLNLRTIVDEALAMHSPVTQSHDLELAVIFHPNTPLHFLGDSNRLKQIITNLLSNAVKFTEQGSVIVEVSCTKRTETFTEITFAIKDTGIGISKEDGKKLFQAFSRVNSVANQRREGTGLGLVICKSLVKQMRGKIDFISEPGQGSCFWFTVVLTQEAFTQEAFTQEAFTQEAFTQKALAQEALAQEALAQEHPKLGSQNKSSALRSREHPGRCKSIAVVSESKEWTRKAISRQLEDLGFEVHELDSRLRAKGSHSQRGAKGSQSKPLATACLFVIGVHQDEERNQPLLNSLNVFMHNGARLLLLSDQQHMNALSHLVTDNIALLPLPLMQKQLTKTLARLFEQRSLSKSESAPESAPLPAPSATTQVQRPATKGLHILAVDDSHSHLKLLKTILEDMGIRVDTANSGYEAIAKVKEHDYSLVFMDIQMSGIDGVETCEKIRALEQEGEHLPVIALTANTLMTEQPRFQASFFDNYLAKPVSEQQLLRVINDWIRPAPSHKTTSRLAAEKRSVEIKCEKEPVDKAVDKEEGLQLAGGRKALSEDLLEMLLDTLPTALADIEHLQKQENTTGLMEVIHKLHGAARYCGVPDLRAACKEVEGLLNQSAGLEVLGKPLNNLKREIDRLQRWREQYMPEQQEQAEAEKN